MIEIGRYNQTTKDNRYCPFCGCNAIEDEVHFLFHCPTYSMIRNKFYYKDKTLIPNITQLPINGLINRADLRGGCRGCALPPPPPEMTCGFLIQLVFCKKKLCALLVLK